MKISYQRCVHANIFALCQPVGWLVRRTVIQDTLKMGQKYSTLPQAQERVSERVSEPASGQMCGESERASGRIGGPVLMY